MIGGDKTPDVAPTPLACKQEWQGAILLPPIAPHRCCAVLKMPRREIWSMRISWVVFSALMGNACMADQRCMRAPVFVSKRRNWFLGVQSLGLCFRKRQLFLPGELHHMWLKGLCPSPLSCRVNDQAVEAVCTACILAKYLLRPHIIQFFGFIRCGGSRPLGLPAFLPCAARTKIPCGTNYSLCKCQILG